MFWIAVDGIEEFLYYGIDLLGDSVVWGGGKEKEGKGKLSQEGKQHNAVENGFFFFAINYTTF